MSPVTAPLEVVCVGLATRDTIVVMPGWPDPDGRAVVDRIRRAGGGPAATAAVAMARLGVRVAFVGAVGNDDAGAEVRAGLSAEGVELTGLSASAGEATAESVILLDTSAATRAILHAPGAAPGREHPVPETAWVHVDHAGHPAVAGRVPAGRLSVDAGNAVPALDLAGLGLFAPTARALSDRYPGASPLDGMRRALEEGARSVAVTLGDRGAMAADATGAWHVAPVAVEIASTLGAGDVFHGALVASLARGHALPGALRRANLAAALSCRGLDGRETAPTAAELESMLETAPAPEALIPEPA